MITGAPSSGKTTLVDNFSLMGLKCVPDIARYELKSLLGTSVSGESVQAKIVEKYIEITAHLNPNELVIFDYGMPDKIVFQNFM